MRKTPDPEVRGDAPRESEWTEHLEELRRRTIRVLSLFFALTLAAFACSEQVVSFLTAPVASLGVRLYTFAPAEKFMAHLHVAAIVGVAATVPYFLLQVGLFLWPGLKGNERRYARFALLVVPVLFFGGAGAAYRFFAPVVLKFFLFFGGEDGVEALWSMGAYLSLLAGLAVGAGLLLQLPLLLLLLFASGITTPERVSGMRPAIVLLIFFLAGVCTPPDVTSQVMLGVPLYLLFEGTLVLGRAMRKKG